MALRRRMTMTFSSGGIFEQDDGDNFDQVTKSGISPTGRKYPVNLQMGIGHDRTSEAAPGIFSYTTGETNQRSFYARWAEMMDAPTWSQITMAPRARG